MKMRCTAATGPGPRGVVGMCVHDITAPGIARRWADGQRQDLLSEEAAQRGQGDRTSRRREPVGPNAKARVRRARGHGRVWPRPPSRLEGPARRTAGGGDGRDRDGRPAHRRCRGAWAGPHPARGFQAGHGRSHLRRDGVGRARLSAAGRLHGARALRRGGRHGLPPSDRAEVLRPQVHRLRVTAHLAELPPLMRRRAGGGGMGYDRSRYCHGGARMEGVRPFLPRREPRMGEVVVEVTVTNGRDLTRTKRFEALVDTGAYGLVLPLAWKDELGELEAVATVDLETADQRLIEADVWGPVWIQIEGFRRINSEVIFVEMEPGPNGYQPLLGYFVLEQSNVVVDPVSRRLVSRKRYLFKSAACA